MLEWHRWSGLWQNNKREFTSQINLGNGHTMRAEDLIDGHPRRLKKADEGNVEVGISRNLTAAVRVIAPQLAPLTDLAQEIADQSPITQPKGKFRSDLQRALETTHRQQNVRRTLGIQPPAKKDPPFWQSPWFVALVAVLVVITVGLIRQKNRQRQDQ